MAVFTGNPGQDDNFQGYDGVSDIFEFAVADLNGADTINGKLGFDLLKFLTPGTVSASSLSGVTNVDIVQFDWAGTSITFTDAFFAVNGDYHTPGHNYGLVQVVGTSGADTVDASGTTLTDYYLLMQTQGGNDTLLGGLGTETIVIQGSPAGDTISGGGGSNLDTVQFTGVSTILSADFAGISGIERLVFGNSNNTVYLTNALVGSAYNTTLQIFGASGNDTFYGGNITNSAYRLEFTSLDGNDTLTGGAGNDLFNFNVADLTQLDTVDGKGGYDTLVLKDAGFVSYGVLFGVSRIEAITFVATSTSLSIDDTFVARNPGLITITGTIGNDFVDASTVTATTGGLVITAGLSADTFLGGAGTDTFIFEASTSNDVVSGGGGSNIDTLQFTNALSLSSVDFANVSGIERLALANGTNSVLISNALVASANGAQLEVVGGTGADTLYAANVSSGKVVLNGGSGNDILDGGAGADTLIGGADNDTLTGRAGANVLTGGSGADTFNFILRDGVAETVTDFLSADDTLQFRASVFDINGAAFDTRTAAASTATDITGADLVVYTGGTLNSAADARAYLLAAAGGSVGEGLFIAGTNSAGETVLFHATDASTSISTSVDFIGTLGTLTAATDLQLSDFAFT